MAVFLTAKKYLAAFHKGVAWVHFWENTAHFFVKNKYMLVFVMGIIHWSCGGCMSMNKCHDEKCSLQSFFCLYYAPHQHQKLEAKVDFFLVSH